MKIAIAGQICSGKSTLANYLIEKYPFLIKKSFAGKVKEIATDLFDMKEKDRNLLQSIGTSMRSINPDVWVNYIIKCDEKHIIIDDLRYENEARILKDNNWYIIRLNITDELQKSRIIKTYPDTFQEHLNNLEHESELEISILDKYIDLELESNNIDYNKLNYFINDIYIKKI